MGTWTSNQLPFLSRGDENPYERIKSLEAQRNALAIDYQELDALRRENVNLKEQLDFLERSGEEAVTATIIARTSTNQASRFVINRGANDGILEGAPVIVGKGYFVGKVTAVGPASATVTASTDPSMAVAGALLNQSRTLGVAQGSFGKLIRLSFIPHDEVIRENDLVVTSGLEDLVSSGLLIGIVNKVDSELTSPFQEAVVEPLADINEFSTVSVLVRKEIHE